MGEKSMIRLEIPPPIPGMGKGGRDRGVCRGSCQNSGGKTVCSFSKWYLWFQKDKNSI